MRSVAQAIAQQELEGSKALPFTVADLHRAARGQIETDEVIRNIYLPPVAECLATLDSSVRWRLFTEK